MRLRATVVGRTGATVHRRAEIVKGVLAPGEELPAPSRVEIEETSSGVFLFHYDAAGRCVADTWHATVKEAKEQARFEFGIEENEWREVANGGGGP